MKLKKPYLVKWLDAANHGIDWTDKSKLKSTPATILSVGILTHKCKDTITLTQNLCVSGPGEASGCNCITIPRGCIIQTERLK